MDRFSYSRNGDNGHVDQNCQVRVQIPGVDTRGKHVSYQIRVTNIATRQSWDVSRRFSEFLQVRNALLAYFKGKEGSKCPGCVNYEKVLRLFEFPRKHMFTSVSPVVLNYRKVALRSFVALLASHTFTTKPKCPTCSGFAFTAVQDFLTTDLKPASADATAAAAVSSDTIRESIDVRNFTEHRPAAKLRAVDSNGKFTTGAPHARKQQQHAAYRDVSKPRPNAQKKHVDHDEEHSSTGSSSGSFGSAASPVAALPTPPVVAPPMRRAQQQDAPASTAPTAAPGADPVEDDGNDGSFVSFTAGVTRPTRSSSRASRNSSFIARRSSGAVVIKKKSERKKFNFARRRTSSAMPRESMDGDVDNSNDDDEINMDFLQVSTTQA